MEGLNQRRQAVNGSRVLILGVAYKRNTGDARESPVLVIIDRLAKLGADVRTVDPLARGEHAPRSLHCVDLCEDEVRESDVVLLLADHDVFDYDLTTTHARYVLDTRRRMTGHVVEHL